MKKSLFKNAIYKSLLTFVNIGVPLLIGPYVIKLLDKDLYGMYHNVFAQFQIFMIFATLGVYTHGVREVSKARDDKEKVSELFSSLFVISITASAVVGVCYIAFAMYTYDSIPLSIASVLLVQIVGNAFYMEFVNEALEDYGFITIKSLIIKVLYMVSILTFVKKTDDVVIYTLIVSLTVFFDYFISFIRINKHVKLDFKKVKFAKHIGPLLTIFIINNVGIFYGQLDKVMLGSYIDGVAVTMYYIPYYIVGTMASIPYSVTNVSIPRLAYYLENEERSVYENAFETSSSALFFLIIPMCLGIAVLAPEVIYLYAGEQYMAATSILVVACIVRLGISVESVLINLVLYPTGSERSLVKFTFGCGILNLIMNFTLIYLGIFSPFWVLLTTGIAESLLAFICYVYARRKLKLNISIFTKRNVLYLLLSLTFIPISYIISIQNFSMLLDIGLTIMVCFAVYVGTLFLLKDKNLFLILGKFSSFARRISSSHT